MKWGRRAELMLIVSSSLPQISVQCVLKKLSWACHGHSRNVSQCIAVATWPGGVRNSSASDCLQYISEARVYCPVPWRPLTTQGGGEPACISARYRTCTRKTPQRVVWEHAAQNHTTGDACPNELQPEWCGRRANRRASAPADPACQLH